MKLRKLKRKIYRNRKLSKKPFIMKFIEVGSNLYPFNENIIFKKKISTGGDHSLFINYTNSNIVDIEIGNITNYQNLPFETQIRKCTTGKIKEINFG